MHRFFVFKQNIDENQGVIIIDAEQSKHIDKVLRKKNGDEIICFDGSEKEFLVRLIGRQDGLLKGEIISVRINNAEPQIDLRLIQGIAKGDKMDTIIQKAVEIGVNSFYPVITEHTVVNLDQTKALSKLKRWEKVAIEACKQCRRNTVPSINPVDKLTNLLSQYKDENIIMLYEKEKNQNLKTLLKNNISGFINKPIYLLVGPEGGFSPKEVDLAISYGVNCVSLGKRILRTETAAIVASSIILYEYDGF